MHVEWRLWPYDSTKNEYIRWDMLGCQCLVVVGNVGRWIICCLPLGPPIPSPVSLCCRWAAEVNMHGRCWLGFLPDLQHQPMIIEPSPCSGQPWAVHCNYLQRKKEGNIITALFKIPPLRHIEIVLAFSIPHFCTFGRQISKLLNENCPHRVHL